MIKESIVELINAIADGNTLAIEDSFNSVMASKISDRLDSMRVDVAQGMFGSVDESYDSSDAYETWDPKHPKFKDKLIKHHAKGGTTQSFIDQEKAKAKKKLTREEVELDEISNDLANRADRMRTNRQHAAYDTSQEAGEKSSIKAAATHKLVTNTIARNQAITANKSQIKTVKESFDIEDYSVEELEDFMMSEEFEQLDELSKKTLGSYVKKATTNAIISGEALGKGEKWSKSGQIASKREKGIGKAVDKLTKEDLDEESDPTGVKIYHTDKSGKAGSHIVFTSQDANRLHSQIKKAGGKVTHHALMFGTKEGEKKPLSEEVEYMSESDKAIKRLKKEYDTHMNKYNAAPFGSQEAAMHNKNAEKVMDKINIHREMSK